MSTTPKALIEAFPWRGREIRWERWGAGPAVVFCHGTPWSSELWRPMADALAANFSVYLWDMPGFGASSKNPAHRVSLDLQGELFVELLAHWRLSSPHVVTHDIGGAVALRAHLLHGASFDSLALVDVVALAPWGSDFFRLVRDYAHVFTALPHPVHEGALRAYIAGASHLGLTSSTMDMLVDPWLGPEGLSAFYRQIAQIDQTHTDELEPFLREVRTPTLVIWGKDDAWLPVSQATRLRNLIPGHQMTLIDNAGHLIQCDQPEALAVTLTQWLTSQ